MSVMGSGSMSLSTGSQSAMGSFSGIGSNVTNIYNVEVINGVGGSDGTDLGEMFITAIKKYERTSGPVFAAAL